MRLVIDTNKLFTFFWSGSLLYKLLRAGHLLYSPEFALEELKNNKFQICDKSGLLPSQFEEFFLKLKKVVSFISFEKYHQYIPMAYKLLLDNIKDIDFISLAMYLDAGIISDDKELKNQSKIKIFSKSDFSDLF